MVLPHKEHSVITPVVNVVLGNNGYLKKDNNYAELNNNVEITWGASVLNLVVHTGFEWLSKSESRQKLMTDYTHL